MSSLVRRFALLLALFLTVAACATQQQEAYTGDVRPRRDSSRLTRQEIMETHTNDVYEAVRILRPNWLRKRGAMSVTQSSDIVVYMDNVAIGGPEALRSVPVSTVTSMQFLDASSATQRWGTNHVHGAILVLTM